MAKQANADYPGRKPPAATKVKNAKPSPGSVIDKVRKKQLGRNGYAAN